MVVIISQAKKYLFMQGYAYPCTPLGEGRLPESLEDVKRT
jgi:hypothetical protein